MKEPLVSVLVCTYNAEKFIRATLLSVLNQSYKNIEVLILDNASIDKTRDVIKQFCHPERAKRVEGSLHFGRDDKHIKTIYLKNNIGPYEGLNFLLGKAKGEYIAINDHDDIWYPDKLERQIALLEKNKEYVGCGTAIINWYEKYNKQIYRSQPEKSDIAWHTSLVFRNKSFRYDSSVLIGTDFHFMKNILCGNKKLIYNFQEPLVLRRIFAGKQNLSGQWMKKVSFLDIIKLKINILDKLALINRALLPQRFVEWTLIKILGNNIPAKYEDYAKTFSSTMSSLRQ